MIAKEAIDTYLAQPRKSYDWVKSLTRAEMVLELKERFGQGNWPFLTRPDKHQMACYLVGLNRRRFLYFLDMGGGKTKLVLDLFRHYKKEGIVTQLLVFVPKKVHIGSWQENVREHASDLVYEGIDATTIATKWERLEQSEADVVCIDYMGFELAVTGKVKVGKKTKLARDDRKLSILKKKYQALVFDEVHRCKNHESLRYRLTNTLSAQAEMVYGLTGTFTGRNPEVMWSQFNLVDRGDALGKTLSLFRAGFFLEKPNYFGGKDYKFDQSKLPLLRKFMRHSSLRYDEQEFADLPPLVATTETFVMTPEQKAEYDRVRKGQIVRGVRVPTDGVFHHMRRICSGYMRVEHNGVQVTVRFEENPKLDLLESWVEAVPEGRKMLIFFEYTESGRIIGELLESMKVGHIILDGSAADPVGIEARFNNSDKVRALVIQNSCSEGLNVQSANYQRFFELPTSPDTWQQALKRAHRRGQERRVFVTYSHARGSVEEKIMGYLEAGRNLLRLLSANAKDAHRDLFEVVDAERTGPPGHHRIARR